MDKALNRAWLFLKLISLFIVAFFFQRLYFYLKYPTAFGKLDSSDLLVAFTNGVRFDLATAAAAMLPFLFILFIPGVLRRKGLVNAVLWALLAWQAGLMVYNFIDIQYYEFVNRHITFELGKTWRETDMLLMIGVNRYLLDGAGLILFIVAYAWLFLKVTKKTRTEPGAQGGLAAETVWLIVFLAVTAVMARGGLQKYSLNVRAAFVSEKVEIGMLSLNGVYTSASHIVKSAGKKDKNSVPDLGPPGKPMEQVAAMIVDAQREEAGSEYPLYRKFSYGKDERRPMNVVVFVMESWSSKYIGAINGGKITAAPFFDKLSKEGLLLTNFIANAQRSIEALTAMMGSFPVLSGMVLGDEGYLYQTNFKTSGDIFKSLGYDTMFIHGTEPGILDIDQLVARMGFDWRVSRDDFMKGGEVKDRLWGIGIYDEHTFAKAHEKFEESEKPFFSIIFSLTSHTPYIIPKGEPKHFGKDTPHHEFLNSMRYSDKALGKFFEKAKGSKYFDNTLFVIMADHSEGPSTIENLYENHWIPALFYAPGLVKPGRYGKVASHIDVIPTILDLLKISEPHNSWGRSIFNGGPERFALAPRGEFTLFVKDPYMLLFDFQRPVWLFDYKTDPNKVIEDKERGEGTVSMKMYDEAMDYLKFSMKLISSNRIKPAGGDAPLAPR